MLNQFAQFKQSHRGSKQQEVSAHSLNIPPCPHSHERSGSSGSVFTLSSSKTYSGSTASTLSLRKHARGHYHTASSSTSTTLDMGQRPVFLYTLMQSKYVKPLPPERRFSLGGSHSSFYSDVNTLDTNSPRPKIAYLDPVTLEPCPLRRTKSASALNDYDKEVRQQNHTLRSSSK